MAAAATAVESDSEGGESRVLGEIEESSWAIFCIYDC